MSELFHDTYFGKPYKTKDNHKALFSRFVGNENERYAILYLDRSYAEIECTLDGRFYDCVGGKPKFWHDTPYIVSEWQEEIDEEKLNKLAKAYINNSDFNNDTEEYHRMSWIEKDAFKAGYRKAKSE